MEPVARAYLTAAAGGEPRMGEERVVAAMALLRLLSAAMEITAAVLMVRSGQVADAMRINGALGLIGPLVLAAVTGIGMVGLAGRLPAGRMALLALAVGLILASLSRSR